MNKHSHDKLKSSVVHHTEVPQPRAT